MKNQFNFAVRGKIFSLLLFSVFILNKGYSQQRTTVKGKVIDGNKQPLSFSHIVIKGKESEGVVADYNGEFSIDVTKKDTLLFSYLGYKNKELPLQNDTFYIIKLESDNLMINEFIVNSKDYTPKEIIELTFNKKWKKNHEDESTQNAYKFLIKSDISIKNKGIKIYNFNGLIPLFYIKNKGAFGFRKDSRYIEETEKFLNFNLDLTEQENNLIQRNCHPSFSIKNILGKHIINNLFTFSFGDVFYYENTPVYQIKYYRKGNKKFCESGGFFLIDKSNYTLLYAENIVKNCLIYTKDTKKTQLLITEEYHKSTVSYSSQLKSGKYMPNKISVIGKLSVKSDNLELENYYTTTDITVEKITILKESKIDLNSLIPIKQVFIK